MVRTSLYSRQQKMGATFSDFHGWELPVRYSSFEAEHVAATLRVALRDASAGGRLMLRGPDALDLLHRLSTNDLLALKPGEGTRTVLTNNKGRVLDLLRVYYVGDYLLVYTSPQRLQKVIEWIDLYTFLEDLTVTDITADTLVLELVGPNGAALLEHFTEGNVSLQPGGVIVDSVHGIPVTIFRDDSLGLESYGLMVGADSAVSLWEDVLEQGQLWELSPMGSEVHEVLRIKAGLPMYGQELTEQVNPLEAGLRPSISFTKGCYIGQEVVLRLDTFRKVQRHLVRLDIEGQGVPSIGDKLLVDGKTVGTLTSIGKIQPQQNIIALALIRTAYDQPGQELEIASQAHHWIGRVISLDQYALEGSGV
jgi:folate-binding protein YgfZ